MEARFSFKVWDSGADVDGGVRPCEEPLRDLLAAFKAAGGTVEEEHEAPLAGDGVTYVLVVLLALPAAINHSIQIAEKLAAYLRAARASREVAATDQEGLLLVAYDEVRRVNPRFRTDPELVQVLGDGEGVQRRAPAEKSNTTFPAGVFLFRIPDLDSGHTHLLELRADGSVVSHVVRAELTADAVEYLEAARLGDGGDSSTS